jgi:protein-L-isoaspartate O-methyltransferase
MLAAQVQGGVIGEMGTGVGVGTAWMAQAMPRNSRIVTIEVDARLKPRCKLRATANNQGPSLTTGYTIRSNEQTFAPLSVR